MVFCGLVVFSLARIRINPYNKLIETANKPNTILKGYNMTEVNMTAEAATVIATAATESNRKGRTKDMTITHKLLAALQDMADGGENVSRPHKLQLVEMGLVTITEVRTSNRGRAGHVYTLSGQGKSRLALLQRNAAKAEVRNAKENAKTLAARAAEAGIFAATLMQKAVEAQATAEAAKAAAEQAKADADAMATAQA